MAFKLADLGVYGFDRHETAILAALTALYGLETRRLRRSPKLDVAICDIKLGRYSKTTACLHGARRHPVLVPAAISDLTRRFLDLDRPPSRSIVVRSKGLRRLDGRPATLDRDSLKSEDARRNRTLPVADGHGSVSALARRSGRSAMPGGSAATSGSNGRRKSWRPAVLPRRRLGNAHPLRAGRIGSTSRDPATIES